MVLVSEWRGTQTKTAPRLGRNAVRPIKTRCERSRRWLDWRRARGGRIVIEESVHTGRTHNQGRVFPTLSLQNEQAWVDNADPM